MKMDLMTQQLLEVIEEEREIYRSMLTLIDKESKAAVRLDLKGLTKAGEKKQNIFRYISTNIDT